MQKFEIKEITSVEEMLKQFDLLRLLTPDITQPGTQEMLQEMVKNKYRMIGVFDNLVCVGLSGIWIGTKLYSGKYLEIDNFVTHPGYRSKGIGKLLVNYIDQIAKAENCKCIMLDAYVTNPAAHKFYLREGFIIRGFHFIKSL